MPTDIVSQRSVKVKESAPVAVIYARFSSTNQRDASIDDQIRVCREYCEKSGILVSAEYADRALSGLTDKRPEFQRMIKDAERHLFDTLIVYAMDRFARNKYDSAIYKARLRKAGIRIIYVTTPVGEGPEAVLMESLLEGMAQYYSENLARSVRRGLEGNALKGIHTSGHVPLGYQLDASRHYIIDPAKAELVRRIFTMYADGMTQAAIIRRLNAEGHLTGTGRPFTANSFAGILCNEAYIGVFRWNDIRIENSHPAIISPELFERVRRMRDRNRQSKASGKAKVDYILTGKVFCGHCGAWLVGESGHNHAGRTYNYYTCSRHKKGKHCPKTPERKSDLEALALKACRDALTDSAILEISTAAAANLAAEAARNDITPALKNDLRDTERKITNIMAAIEDGIYTPTTRDRLAELESRKASLTEQIATHRTPPILTAEQIAFWLTKLRSQALTSPSYDSTLINTLLNSLTLTDTPDGKKRAVLLLNTESNTAPLTLTGSDINELMEYTTQYPNIIIYKSLPCFILTIDSDIHIEYNRRKKRR